MSTLSACLVIHNSEKYLERCLQSLEGIADEIVIVHDGPCKDKSTEIAQKYQAGIFVQPYIGEAEAHRPFGYAQAQGEWVLFIDADEFLPEQTRRIIPSLMERQDADAYSFLWPYHNGKNYIQKGPYNRILRPCLFRKNKMYYLGISHLCLATYGNLEERPDVLMEHRPDYNNYTWDSFRKKWLPWSRLEARQILNYKNAPRFQIIDPENNPMMRLCKRKAERPIYSCLRECTGYKFYVLKNGLLTAGLESWKIYFLHILRIISVYYYILKLRYAP